MKRAASACDTCAKPGACCDRFVLNLELPKHGWRSAAVRILARHGLSYMKPLYPSLFSADRPRIQAVFTCTRLGADGRCTDYENRPQLCRDYKPRTDSLCWETLRTFKGIPIVEVK